MTKVPKVTFKEKRKSNAGEWHDAFFATLRNSANVRVSCEKAGIARKTAYQWRKRDKDFAKQWQDALDDAIELLEDIARKRAEKSSDVLIMFLLKAHRPEKYRERYEHTGLEGKHEQLVVYLPENYRDISKPLATKPSA